jgi:diguanylate cyclase (GGDEF)-like protein/PAS domain S-box-containing protein
MDASERHVLDQVPVGLYIWEAMGDDLRSLTLRYANGEASRQAGFDAAAVVGQALPDVFPHYDVPWNRKLLAACLSGEPAQHVLRVGDRWWHAQATPLGSRQAVAAYWDVTEHKRRERSLRASEQLNREILAGLQEGVIVLDTRAHVVVANEAAAALFGTPLRELADRSWRDIPVEVLDDRGRLLAFDELPLVRALQGEEVTGMVVRFVRPDGSLLWVEVHANPLRDEDGGLFGAVASFDDVSVRVERDRRTRHEADHDALTGLANRRSLQRTLEAALTRARGRARSVGVIMLDLDGFKAINDTHGHATGDEALREVAARLRHCVRERDLVARLGGDEFVVVLSDLGGRSTALRDSVDRIRDALCAPFRTDSAELELNAAIGVAAFPEDGDQAAELLAHADRRMYADKGARRGSLR